MNRFGRGFQHLLEDWMCDLQRTKGFIVTSVGGATGIANLRWNISKTQTIGHRVVPNTSYVYYGDRS